MGRWVSYSRTSLKNVASVSVARVNPGAVVTRVVNPAPPVVGERRPGYKVLVDPADVPRAGPGEIAIVVERPD